MIDQLFGSGTRVKLLRLFLADAGVRYYVRELTRKIGERINSVRRELGNLEKIGLLKSDAVGQKKYYQVDTNFILYPELKNLIVKSQLTLEKDLAKNIRQIGQISYLALTGVFTGINEVKTDILIVGKVSRKKLRSLIKKFHGNYEKRIRYTVMTKKEFEFRNNLTDRFLFDILENNKIVIIDKLFSK